MTTTKYDVFLNFRGEDLRRKFVDHLYARLQALEVNAFMDEKHLARGQVIQTSILTAIQHSRVYLAIFSSGYADSEWCLDELVKIVECVDHNKGHVVMPVFFLVSPADVVGVYGEAFARHQKVFPEKRVQGWKNALVTVAGISGWTLRHDESEAKLVEKISKTIKEMLEETTAPETHMIRASAVATGGNPSPRKFNISQTIKELNLFSCQMLENMAVLRICGLGGLHSTNSAKLIYDNALITTRTKSTRINLDPTRPGPELKWSRKIWDSDGDINAVRTSVGNNKKVLALVDDTDKLEALLLVGVMLGWFGPGSRLVLSTVDVCKRVLKVVHMYMEASGGREDMNNNEMYLDVACFAKERVDGGELVKRVLKALANGGMATDIIVKVRNVEYENVGMKENGELEVGRAGRRSWRSWAEDQPRLVRIVERVSYFVHRASIHTWIRTRSRRVY
ncbi:Disease resistance protein L6 [Linum grandiflorum]